MPYDSELSDSCPPERFVVEVFSELGQETVQQRWREVNVILRLSMLSGLPMQLDAAFNMLCDFSAEVVSYDRAVVYFWEESTEQMLMRLTRGLEPRESELLTHGNILNFWASKYGRPLLVGRGYNIQADALLNQVGAESALVVPLLVSNRTLGSMQVFSRAPNAFKPEDAQLLWTLALVAETLLTRE